MANSYNISAGQTSSGYTLNSGDTLTVSSGGTATYTTVNNSGSESVQSGGTTSDTVVNSGGFVSIDGGVAEDTTISSGGQQDVFSGGAASGTTLEGSSSYMYVTSGSVTDTLVLAGGTFGVKSGGVAVSTTLSGATASGIVTHAYLFVSAGGFASDTVVQSDGGVGFRQGGSGLDTTVSYGGYDIVSSGSMASDTTVMSGGEELAYSGGTVSGSTISSGGLEIVSSGGTADGVTVATGGAMIVMPGAVANTTSGDGLVISTGVVIVSGQLLVSASILPLSDAVISGGGVVELVLPQGSALGTNISSGGIATVYSGGLASGAAITGGGEEFVLSGGIASGTVVSGVINIVSQSGEFTAGELDVLSGGTSYNTAVEDGGNLTVRGESISATLSGTASVTSSVRTESTEDVFGGTASATTVESGSQLLVSGGTAAATVVADGGSMLLEGDGTATSVSVLSGGFASILGGSTVSGVILNGGQALLGRGAIVSGAVTFAGEGGTLTVYSGLANTLSGFAAADNIDLAGIAYHSGDIASVTSGNVLVVTQSGGTQETFNLDPASNYGGYTFALTSDPANNGTLVTAQGAPCYCAGTLIATDQGERPVECLAVGDRVVTYDGRVEPIKWIGSGQMLITPGNRGLLAPVIVRAGALRPGLPRRDLYITRDHALLLPGPDGDVLVAAEHLVNGSSVVWDDRPRVLDYYHIELDAHAILLAEGAPAESFRDAGSAALFQNARTRPPAARAQPPCVPLASEPSALNTAWLAVAGRAGFVGEITEDPDLHLLADGMRINAVGVSGQDHLTFSLPRRPRELLLVSRSAVPAALGLSADRRRLGVAVGAITFVQDGARISFEANSGALSHGFHPAERGYRWTTGVALLPVPPLAAAPFTTTVGVVGTLRYRVAARRLAGDGRRRVRSGRKRSSSS